MNDMMRDSSYLEDAERAIDVAHANDCAVLRGVRLIVRERNCMRCRIEREAKTQEGFSNSGQCKMMIFITLCIYAEGQHNTRVEERKKEYFSYSYSYSYSYPLGESE